MPSPAIARTLPAGFTVEAHLAAATARALDPSPYAPVGAPALAPVAVPLGRAADAAPELVIAATIHHAGGDWPAILLTSQPIYIDTRTGYVELATAAGPRTRALAPGRLVIADTRVLSKAEARALVQGR